MTIQNIDRDPEYVRERIEGTHDLGRKFLVSVALCIALIATIEAGYIGSDLSVHALAETGQSEGQSPLQAHEFCGKRYPA